MRVTASSPERDGQLFYTQFVAAAPGSLEWRSLFSENRSEVGDKRLAMLFGGHWKPGDVDSILYRCRMLVGNYSYIAPVVAGIMSKLQGPYAASLVDACDSHHRNKFFSILEIVPKMMGNQFDRVHRLRKEFPVELPKICDEILINGRERLSAKQIQLLYLIKTICAFDERTLYASISLDQREATVSSRGESSCHRVIRAAIELDFEKVLLAVGKSDEAVLQSTIGASPSTEFLSSVISNHEILSRTFLDPESPPFAVMLAGTLLRATKAPTLQHVSQRGFAVRSHDPAIWGARCHAYASTITTRAELRLLAGEMADWKESPDAPGHLFSLIVHRLSNEVPFLITARLGSTVLRELSAERDWQLPTSPHIPSMFNDEADFVNFEDKIEKQELIEAVRATCKYLLENNHDRFMHSLNVLEFAAAKALSGDVVCEGMADIAINEILRLDTETAKKGSISGRLEVMASAYGAVRAATLFLSALTALSIKLSNSQEPRLVSRARGLCCTVLSILGRVQEMQTWEDHTNLYEPRDLRQLLGAVSFGSTELPEVAAAVIAIEVARGEKDTQEGWEHVTLLLSDVDSQVEVPEFVRSLAAFLCAKDLGVAVSTLVSKADSHPQLVSIFPLRCASWLEGGDFEPLLLSDNPLVRRRGACLLTRSHPKEFPYAYEIDSSMDEEQFIALCSLAAPATAFDIMRALSDERIRDHCIPAALFAAQQLFARLGPTQTTD